jgi:hypothetical protein
VFLPASGGTPPSPLAASEQPPAPTPAPREEPPATPPPQPSTGNITGTEPLPRFVTGPTQELPVAATPAAPQETRYKSVLTLFKEYKGTRGLHELTALFSQASYPGFRQEPAVALTDGRTNVKLSIDLTGSDSPNFAVSGGTILSLKRERDRYLLTLSPKAGAVETTVTVLNKGIATIIPLTVAPPLDKKSMPTGKYDEAAFALYLKGGDLSKGDVNGDGVKNYLDDYIVTSNYLAKNNMKQVGTRNNIL